MVINTHATDINIGTVKIVSHMESKFNEHTCCKNRIQIPSDISGCAKCTEFQDNILCLKINYCIIYFGVARKPIKKS